MVVIEAHIDRGSEVQDAGPESIRDPVDGRSPAIPMDEGGEAPSTQGRTEPADLADGSPEELGGLGHQQLAAIKGI